MPRTGTGPDFIEALARGLEVITAFEPGRDAMSLSDVAVATGLARPTARRILLTLVELGYVRADGSRYTLTPRAGCTPEPARGSFRIRRRRHRGSTCSVTRTGRGSRSRPSR